MAQKSPGQIVTLRFAPFTAVQLEKTRKAWLKEAAADEVFPTSIERHFAWAKDHMEPVDGDGTAFGIFENSDDVAAAMCEVVVSRRSKTSTWVRHLQLWLRPQLDDEVAAGEISAVGQALELFVESIKGVIELKVKHAATTMKVYGRTPDQMKFLQLAAANMQQRLTAHEISMEGRFLVLTTKKVAP